MKECSMPQKLTSALFLTLLSCKQIKFHFIKSLFFSELDILQPLDKTLVTLENSRENKRETKVKT